MRKAKKAVKEAVVETETHPIILRHFLIILIVGITARFVYNWQLSGSLFFGVYQLDDLVIHSWALDIV